MILLLKVRGGDGASVETNRNMLHEWSRLHISLPFILFISHHCLAILWRMCIQFKLTNLWHRVVSIYVPRKFLCSSFVFVSTYCWAISAGKKIFKTKTRKLGVSKLRFLEFLRSGTYQRMCGRNSFNNHAKFDTDTSTYSVWIVRQDMNTLFTEVGNMRNYTVRDEVDIAL